MPGAFLEGFRFARHICICYSTGRSDIRDIFHEL